MEGYQAGGLVVEVMEVAKGAEVAKEAEVEDPAVEGLAVTAVSRSMGVEVVEGVEGAREGIVDPGNWCWPKEPSRSAVI